MASRRATLLRGGLGLALLAAVWAPASASAADPVLCDSLEATIVGTDGPDELVGLPGVDVIAGLGGDDQVTGDLADDVVCGGDGDDTVVGPGPLRALGGPGNDYLEVTGGAMLDDAFLYGEDGDDVLVAGPIVVDLFGGDGDDRLLGGPSRWGTRFYPGLGRDYVDGGDSGGGRDDDSDSLVMEQDAGPVSIDLTRGFAKGQGRDTIKGIENISGTPYGDRLVGDDGPNVISVYYTAGPEPDVMHGRGGDDDLLGGSGTRIGGKGDDTVRLLTGVGTDDHLDGGGGYDWIDFSVGPVRLDLEAGTASGPHIGNDVVLRFEAASGTESDDTFFGTDADNELDGWGGDDLLDGRGGNDSIRGLSENDTLLGGLGDDTLDGGKNTNSVNGGPGLDTCYRGSPKTNCEK